MNKKQIVKNDTTKEVGNMVKKAETLNSLDELGLSSRTRTYLLKNFDAIDTIVIVGRELAFELEVGTLDAEKCPKWATELASVLRKNGFIRPAVDFVRSFSIGFLYASIFWDNRESFFCRISQLSNEQYESFVDGISDEDIEIVRLSLYDRLTEREYKVICRRFGLDCNEGRDLESVAHYFQVSRERIRQIEVKALRKLRNCNTLPALFDAPNELNNDIDDLKNELDELHKDPIFERERELLMKLERMKKLPFRYSDMAGGQLNLNELLDFTPVERLGLSIRTYNCLKRAKIHTVHDILNYPSGSWKGVRNIGLHCMEEIVEKMHSAGYTGFTINF